MADIMAKQSRLTELFQQKKLLTSIEVFPPKTRDGIGTLLEHLEKLSTLAPDFISVTYGAGGSTQETSLEILEKIQCGFPAPVVAHFTCVGADKQSIGDFVQRLERLGVINILALRGDAPKDRPDFDFSRQAFRYANELVSYLKSVSQFCICVAGYPEGHVECFDRQQDWDHLKSKIEAGGEAVITQLFLDNADFYEFRDGLAKRGVNVPVVPGILPIPSISSFERIIKLSGSKVTPQFQKIVGHYGSDADGFRKASIEYSQRQIEDLVRNGVPGIHYYCLNRSEMILEVVRGLNVK